jgi:hypothetical protein
MINLYLSVSSDRFGKTHVEDSKANVMSVISHARIAKWTIMDIPEA